MLTRVCNKWSSTFIHRLFLLNSILLGLFLCSLLSDANQPGISTCNTHALEHTGFLFLICDLASLDWQAWWLDGYNRTLQLFRIGKFSRLKLKQRTMTHYFYLHTFKSFTTLWALFLIKYLSRNSTLMTCRYPNLSSASDWLKQICITAWPIRSTSQTWVQLLVPVVQNVG